MRMKDFYTADWSGETNIKLKGAIKAKVIASGHS